MKTKRNKLMAIIPLKYRMAVRKLARLPRYKGSQRYCPICDSHLKCFLPVTFPAFSKDSPFVTRQNAKCPVCGSIERYRLIYLYIKQKTNLFDPPRKKMLHTAPELILTEKFANSRYVDYLSSDIDPGRIGAMAKIDLTDIAFGTDTFDVIVSSHVLEHIENDRKALSELYRVLKPGGWAIIQVPIIAEKTFTNPSAQTEEEKFRAYGKEDHVRGYGKDYKQLLESVGFKVKVDDFVKSFSPEKIEYFGLIPDEEIYFCTK